MQTIFFFSTLSDVSFANFAKEFPENPARTLDEVSDITELSAKAFKYPDGTFLVYCNTVDQDQISETLKDVSKKIFIKPNMSNMEIICTFIGLLT